MYKSKPISNSRNSIYRLATILLLSYAAISSTMKDLSRLQEVAGDIHKYTSSGLGTVARVYSATRSFAAEQEPAVTPQVSFQSFEAPQIAIVAAGASAELAGLGRDGLAAKEVVAFRPVWEKNHDNTSVRTNELSKLLRSEVAYAGKTAACDVHQKLLPQVANGEAKWLALARIPARLKLLPRGVSSEAEIDAATLLRSAPEIQTIIKRIPSGSGKAEWPGVSEFQSLHAIVGFVDVDGGDAEAGDSSGSEVGDDFSIHLMEKLVRGASADDSSSPETQRERE